jgi:hypothetical protein
VTVVPPSAALPAPVRQWGNTIASEKLRCLETTRYLGTYTHISLWIRQTMHRLHLRGRSFFSSLIKSFPYLEIKFIMPQLIHPKRQWGSLAAGDFSYYFFRRTWFSDWGIFQGFPPYNETLLNLPPPYCCKNIQLRIPSPPRNTAGGHDMGGVWEVRL